MYNGRSYGNGWCYYCENCGAYVGTHKNRPQEALGILANKEMRTMKMKCHDKFDRHWKNCGFYTRSECYEMLAREMGIPVEECHFGWFDMEHLKQAYEIVRRWQ